MDTGTVIVRDPVKVSTANVACDARVSYIDQKNDLERQMWSFPRTRTMI